MRQQLRQAENRAGDGMSDSRAAMPRHGMGSGPGRRCQAATGRNRRPAGARKGGKAVEKGAVGAFRRRRGLFPGQGWLAAGTEAMASDGAIGDRRERSSSARNREEIKGGLGEKRPFPP